jgi:hypothetical protein
MDRSHNDRKPEVESDQPYHHREATVAWPIGVRLDAEQSGLPSDPLAEEEGARGAAWARLRSRRARASRCHVRATPATRLILDEVLAAYDPGWSPISHLRHVEGAPHTPPRLPATCDRTTCCSADIPIAPQSDRPHATGEPEGGCSSATSTCEAAHCRWSPSRSTRISPAVNVADASQCGPRYGRRLQFGCPELATECAPRAR